MLQVSLTSVNQLSKIIEPHSAPFFGLTKILLASSRISGGDLGIEISKSVSSSNRSRGTNMATSQKAPVEGSLPTGPSTSRDMLKCHWEWSMLISSWRKWNIYIYIQYIYIYIVYTYISIHIYLYIYTYIYHMYITYNKGAWKEIGLSCQENPLLARSWKGYGQITAHPWPSSQLMYTSLWKFCYNIHWLQYCFYDFSKDSNRPFLLAHLTELG